MRVETSYRRGPLEISHVWPVVLIESRGLCEPLACHVEDETALVCVDLQCLERDSEKLVPEAQEAAERQDCCDSIRLRLAILVVRTIIITADCRRQYQ